MNLKIWHLLAFASVIILVVVLFLPNKREEGILLARSGRVEKAARILDPIIADNPRDIKVIEELAAGYESRNNLGAAAGLYAQYFKNGGDDPDIRQRLVALYVANFEYRKALALLAADMEHNLPQLIDLSVKTGDLAGAVKYSRELLARTDDKAEQVKLLESIMTYENWQLNINGVGGALEELARKDDTLENNFKALEFFAWKHNNIKMRYFAERVSGFKGLSIEQLRVLRATWIRLKDAANALKTAEVITRNKDAEYSDWSDYLTLLEWTGANETLRSTVAELLKKYPDNVELYRRELNLLPDTDRSMARAKLEQRLYNLTGDSTALISALQIYTENKAVKEAKSIYESLLKDKDFLRDAEKNPVKQLVLAEAYWAAGNKDKSLQTFSELYALLSKTSDITQDELVQAAVFAREHGLKEEEANIYLHIFNLTSEVQYLRDARDIFAELKLDDQLIACDKKLLNIVELEPFEQLQLIQAYVRKGMSAEAGASAEKLYRQVLTAKLSGLDDNAFWSALDAASLLKNTAKRAKILERFYRINADPELLREAAELQKSAGDYQFALADYQLLSKDGKLNDFDISEMLGLYRRLGRMNEVEKLALGVIKKALTATGIDKERDQFYLMQEILPAIGRNDLRLKLLQKYAAAGDIESEIMLAEADRDNKQLASARKKLEKVVTAEDSTKAEKLRAKMLLSDIIALEFFAATGKKRIDIAVDNYRFVGSLISEMQEDLSDLTGTDRDQRKEEVDGLRRTLIQFAFAKKDYTAVDELIGTLYERSPGVYLELAALFLNASEKDSALRYFAKIKNTTGFTVEQFAELGRLYADFGEYEKALQFYNVADKKAKGLDKDVRLGLASVYGRMGDALKQYSIVDFYTAFGNSTAEDWLRAADARQEHDDLVGEYNLLLKGVKKKSDSALLLARLVSSMVELGRTKDAVHYAKKLQGLKVHKDERELIGVGYGLLAVGQVREAGRLFAVACNNADAGPEAELALARYFAACFQYPQAHRVYLDYLKHHGNDGRVWYEFAVLKSQAGFIGSREAFIHARDLLSNGEQTAAELSVISSIDIYLNRRDQALRQAVSAVKLQPGNAQNTLALAELYNSSNYQEYGRQTALTVKADEFNSARRDGTLAEAELLSRRFKEGLEELKSVLSIREDDSAAWLAKGYNEFEIGRWLEGAQNLYHGSKFLGREFYKNMNLSRQGSAAVDLDNIELPALED